MCAFVEDMKQRLTKPELDPWTRLIGGMVVTELEGRPVVCQPGEFNIFNAPPGQTCGTYMNNFFAAGGAGYILDNATSACQYCAYNVGNQFYEPLGFDFANRWRDLGKQFGHSLR